MTAIDQGIMFGLIVVVLDFLAWRFLKFDDQRLRLGTRLVLFCTLSYVLWLGQISPFRPAPAFSESARHLFAQGLELLWWFQAGQVSAAFLTRVVLPAKLHQERLVHDVLRALIFLAAAVASVGFVLELPIGGLLATSGALAIILGLAVQSTLGDVFSGVVLNATQPFRIGDYVTIGDIDGEVIESNWRATTLLNGQGNLVVVPNSLAAKVSIVNQSRPQAMHGVTIAFQISSAARPAVVLAALNDSVTGAGSILTAPPPVVMARAVHRKYTDYEVVVYVNTLAKKALARNEIVDQAYRHMRARGVEVFPGVGGPGESVDFRLLRDIDMFSTLDDQRLGQLADSLVHEHFAAGEIVYQVGPTCPDERRALYVVTSGVAVMLTPHMGQDTEVRRLGPGDAVGRAGVLTGVSANIKLRALTAVSTVRLPKEALSPILQDHPEVASRMLGSLLEYQAKAATVLDELPAHTSNREGLVRRLLEGMRRLHGIAR